MIFFSAHGVPVSYVENAGDPYKDEMEECIYLIMQELKARGIGNEHTLAYQVSNTFGAWLSFSSYSCFLEACWATSTFQVFYQLFICFKVPSCGFSFLFMYHVFRAVLDPYNG